MFLDIVLLAASLNDEFVSLVCSLAVWPQRHLRLGQYSETARAAV
jgi:hypothetical protein